MSSRRGRRGGLQCAGVAIESILINDPGEPAPGRLRSPPQPGRSGGEIRETAMPKYSQANRLLSVTTPLGTDVLLLQRFSGEEAISKLFRFELELLAESTATVAFEAILGQGVTVTLVMPADGSKRYFNGIVSRFSQGERSRVGPGGRHLHPLSRRGGPPVLVAHAESPEPDLPADRRPRHPEAGPHRPEASPISSRAPTSRATTASSTARPTSTSPAGSWRRRGSFISSRTPTALTRWWSPTRRRASPTCPARPP